MVQRGLVEIAPPASSAAVSGAAGLSSSARPSAIGTLPISAITPWASGLAGRLLLLKETTRFHHAARWRHRGVIAHGPSFVDQYRRAASYVDRILRGEKPADFPVQAPTAARQSRWEWSVKQDERISPGL